MEDRVEKTIFGMDPFTFIYGGICWITFVYLMFFDGIVYNWWNWIIALVMSGILAGFWPIYWTIVLFRHFF